MRNKVARGRIDLSLFNSPLSRKLISRIFLISLAFIFTNASLQIFVSYRSGLKSIEQKLDLIVESGLDSIRNSAYNLNDRLLQLQLEGILVYEGIVFVQVSEIRGNETHLISAGDDSARKDLVRVHPLVYTTPQGDNREFGFLTLAANYDELYYSLLGRGRYILLENIVFVFFLAIVFFILIEFSITRHLLYLADYANEVDLDKLGLRLRLERGKAVRGPEDELDVLVSSFNNMRVRISEDLKKRISDNEEKQKLERSLNQKRKMESIGRITGGVVHDLNNLITPILLCGELLEKQYGEDDPKRELIENLLTAGQKARDLVAQLMSFSRNSPREYESQSLNDIIRNFETLLRRTLREGIHLSTNLNPRIPDFYTHKGQIEQILMNLAVNAQDAIRGEGVLTIETGMLDRDDILWKDFSGVERGANVLLTVEDTGFGMSREIRDHLFEPFFSTKGVNGTGFGLATVYEIVKQHKGDITAFSEEGKGSRFRILFPVGKGN